MKKAWFFCLLFFACFLFLSCEEAPKETTVEDAEKEEGEAMEFYSDETRDYDLPLFKIAVPKSAEEVDSTRVIVISDNHLNAFGGVGGYTDVERQEKMMEVLLDPTLDYDCVIFAGDMVNQNSVWQREEKETGKTELSPDLMRDFKATYIDRLMQSGVAAYCINASHDSLFPEQFKSIFGYENNYVILVGMTAYICLDSFSGERTKTYETSIADIPASFAEEVKKLLRHSYVQEAFVVCHTPARKENFNAIVAEEKVLGVLSGHSHYNDRKTYNGKPWLETGHFSRGYTKMLTWGLGFTPFVPIDPDTATMTTDEDGKQHKDYSATGSPWQYRVVEKNGGLTEYGLESYMVFPEMTYKDFKSDGNDFPAFTQPYTEARPSFLGAVAPIDKSYYCFIE